MFKYWLPQSNLYIIQKKRYFYVHTGENNALSYTVAFRKSNRINGNKLYTRQQEKKKKISCKSVANILKNIDLQHLQQILLGQLLLAIWEATFIEHLVHHCTPSSELPSAQESQDPQNCWNSVTSGYGTHKQIDALFWNKVETCHSNM